VFDAVSPKMEFPLKKRMKGGFFPLPIIFLEQKIS